MKTYIYARVSTVQQIDGVSIDAQFDDCRKYLDFLKGRNEWHAGDGTAYVSEQISGSVPFAKRERGKELLEALKTGDWLVIAKLDRAWRSAADCLNTISLLKSRGVHVHLCDLKGCVTNGINELVLTIMSGVAAWERERIGERTRDAKRAMAQRGEYLGGKLPWDKALDENGNLVIDPKKTAAVKSLRAWRAEGITLRECQLRLHKRRLSISLDAIRRLTADSASGAALRRGRRPRSEQATDADASAV